MAGFFGDLVGGILCYFSCLALGVLGNPRRYFNQDQGQRLGIGESTWSFFLWFVLLVCFSFWFVLLHFFDIFGLFYFGLLYVFHFLLPPHVFWFRFSYFFSEG